MRRFGKFLLECFLFILAYILFLPLSIINYICVYFTSKNRAKSYFMESAISLDKFANRELRTLWNLTLIKSNGYRFGLIQETISGVLGKNQRDSTLSLLGKVLVFILDTIDKDHCKKSIRELKVEEICL